MTHDNEGHLHGYAAAWSRHDPDEIITFFTEDAVYEDPSYGVEIQGHAAIREFIVDVLDTMPDFHLVYLRCFATERFGAAEYRGSATWNGKVHGMDIDATGVKTSTIGATLFEFRQGRISRNTDHYDYAAHLQALGVLPEDLSEVARVPPPSAHGR
jgi:steroid delta-isomerase-like uncharacterized protein